MKEAMEIKREEPHSLHPQRQPAQEFNCFICFHFMPTNSTIKFLLLSLLDSVLYLQVKSNY